MERKGIELYLEKDGFYAGRMNKDGKLCKGSHKITEEEITEMFSALLRTFKAKTGHDTMFIMGDDGYGVAARLVRIPGEGA